MDPARPQHFVSIIPVRYRDSQAGAVPVTQPFAAADVIIFGETVAVARRLAGAMADDRSLPSNRLVFLLHGL